MRLCVFMEDGKVEVYWQEGVCRILREIVAFTGLPG